MASIPERFELRTESFRHGDFSVEMLVPRSADELIDTRDFDADERMPYWADLWPAARALARDLLEAEVPTGRVLELGCGLGLPSLALAARGADVVASDYYEDALGFVRLNALRNGIAPPGTILLDWRSPDPEIGTFELVAAADVLYERRNALALVDLLPTIVAPRGIVRVADPGRRHHGEFLDLMVAGGWSIAAEREREEHGFVSGRDVVSTISMTDLIRATAA